MDVKCLVAVRPVMRLGRHAEVDGGTLVEPPEQLGAAKGAAALPGAAAGRNVQRLRLEAAGWTAARSAPRRCRGKASRCRRCRGPRRSAPVSMLAWAVQVTAGVTSRSGRCQPRFASACNPGACCNMLGVKPTVFNRTKGCISILALQNSSPFNAFQHLIIRSPPNLANASS